MSLSHLMPKATIIRDSCEAHNTGLLLIDQRRFGSRGIMVVQVLV